MAIIDTTQIYWGDVTAQQKELVMDVLKRQPDLRLSTVDKAWLPAVNHLNMMIAEYVDVGASGFIALYTILLPLKRRYDNGERTPELYNEIMQCE